MSTDNKHYLKIVNGNVRENKDNSKEKIKNNNNNNNPLYSNLPSFLV